MPDEPLSSKLSLEGNKNTILDYTIWEVYAEKNLIELTTWPKAFRLSFRSFYQKVPLRYM